MSGDSNNFLAEIRRHTSAKTESAALMAPDADTITYGELFDLSQRMAAVLADFGVVPGDRVLVQVDKSEAAVALYLACLGAGAVHVPLNPFFTLAEVEYFIKDSEPAAIIAASARCRNISQMAPRAAVLTLDADGIGTLIDAASSLDPLPIANRGSHDLAALVYTSGTTGRPKGAMVTHTNLRHNAEALRFAWAFTPDDVLLHSLPIFHVHGLFVALHSAMLGGSPIHLLPRFDLDTVIRLIPRSTVLMGVPTHYSRLMADPRFNRQLCEGIRLFTSGSAPLPAAAFEGFKERTGHRICERYGMSEAGIITSNPYDAGRVAGTVGFPLTDYQLRIVDDSKQPLGPRVNGFVEINGPHLCSGYWHNSAATEAAFASDGWFNTGDIGRVSPDGRLTLEGRAGDMIISGGENIHPMEIEAIIDRAECVTESAVIGVPHADLGEAVVAVVVVEDKAAFDHDQVARHLDRNLARYKHPKVIEAVAVLPRNAMGKVLKNELRERFSRLFATGAA